MSPYRRQRAAGTGPPRWIERARAEADCQGCGAKIKRGDAGFWYPASRAMYGQRCGCAQVEQAKNPDRVVLEGDVDGVSWRVTVDGNGWFHAWSEAEHLGQFEMAKSARVQAEDAAGERGGGDA